MIELTEEPYDSAVAGELVQKLLVELNERYADVEEANEPSDDDYLAEVTPAMVTRPLGVFVVAWVDGAPLACGALKPLDGDPTTGEIKRMYTRPAGRRQALSRRILDQLEQAAAELGYHRMQLETGTAQPEAIALYESAGWHRIEPYGHYKDSPASVCFGKSTGPR